MTNEQILAFAQSMNYACLNIDSSCCIRYGRPRWEQRLAELSAEQREKLVAKIEHWQQLMKRKRVRG